MKKLAAYGHFGRGNRIWWLFFLGKNG